MKKYILVLLICLFPLSSVAGTFGNALSGYSEIKNTSILKTCGGWSDCLGQPVQLIGSGKSNITIQAKISPNCKGHLSDATMGGSHNVYGHYVGKIFVIEKITNH